jgi:molybdenum cofactor cytidylyltransferase
MTGTHSPTVSLAQALRLDRSTRLALVGAGGKSAALFLLGRQLQQQFGCPVILSASTHLSLEQLALADTHTVIESASDIPDFSELSPGICLFTGPLTPDERAAGLDFTLLEQLSDLAGRQNLPLLVEADGSRRLPLKAPAAHEPALPGFANLVLVAAGLSGLGLPLSPENVHRAEHFAALSGLSLGSPVTSDALARVLLSPQGGLKNIPASARRVLLLNQAVSASLQEQARQLAAQMLPAYHSVLIASLNPAGLGEQGQVHWMEEQAAGVILAAGASRRFGSPKQLLHWQGVPLVRRTALLALEAGLSPVVVVTGAAASAVEEALDGLPVQIVHNPAWQDGQSASVQAGVRALPEQTGAAVFLVSDQPALTASLIKAVLQKRFQTMFPLVAPRVGNRRGNPVLFDRLTFDHLLAIQGDVGGRALLSGDGPFPIAWVDWMDESILLDIDKPEDYDRLLQMGSLEAGKQI